MNKNKKVLWVKLFMIFTTKMEKISFQPFRYQNLVAVKYQLCNCSLLHNFTLDKNPLSILSQWCISSIIIKWIWIYRVVTCIDEVGIFVDNMTVLVCQILDLIESTGVLRLIQMLKVTKMKQRKATRIYLILYPTLHQDSLPPT